jgi:hypothetical protein
MSKDDAAIAVARYRDGKVLVEIAAERGVSLGVVKAALGRVERGA